jgi:D-alanyl-D-alanine carboxypeptidase (penicillin-binding protein 5/6)
MTTEVVLDAIAKGEINRDTQYPVSEYAWRTGGAPSRTSTMFAALKSSIRVEDLLTGIVVQNGNDSCIILAEGLTGSDGAFAKRMTERAGLLGLTHTAFTNSTGLPDPGNKTSAKDMVFLAQHIQKTYPDFYPLFSKPDFEWNRIFQRNKNSLLALNAGIDGMGLGFAEGSGYALVASAERDGRRVFLAMGGLADDKERMDETRRVVEWGLTAFESRRLFDKGASIGTISVYGGAAAGVELAVADPINVLVPVNNPERLSARIVYHWPLNAPVQAGYNAGTLRIFMGESMLREVPLYTTATVEKGTLRQRAGAALTELLFFWL